MEPEQNPTQVALYTPQGVSTWDTAEGVSAIKQTVAKGASDAQLAMFLQVARATGLNPFLREIWFVAQTGMIMAGRDGYLAAANRNPQFDGMETRVERDEKGKPIKAVCTVWRKDRAHPIVVEAYFSEYVKTSNVWQQYPSAMIAKVAEVMALKRSFSINGVVSEEEVSQTPYQQLPPSDEPPQEAVEPQNLPREDQYERLDNLLALAEQQGVITPKQRLTSRAKGSAFKTSDGLEEYIEKVAAKVKIEEPINTQGE